MSILVAVGYLDDKKFSDGPVLESMRETFGSEFTPLKKPYSERQLRNLLKDLVETERRFAVRCLPAFGIGERICGWGGKDRFVAEWALILKNSPVLRAMQLVHNVRARRKEMLSCTQKSA